MTTETFTTPGSNTWVCPANCTSVTIECWGGGGGGGEGNTSTGVGGGGGGAYSKKNTYSVTPGNSYTVWVGAAGDSSGPTNGGDSYFVNSTVCMAKGGTTATGNDIEPGAGGSATSSVGDTKYAGGSGGHGFNGAGAGDGGGGGGGSGGTGSTGNNGGDGTTSTYGAGATAVTGGGAGGNGGRSYDSRSDPESYSTSSVAGSAPGGGGGGAGACVWGGMCHGKDGAAGKVVLTYSITSAPTVTTTAITSVTETDASGGGNVTNGGGLTVTDRGIVWNTSGTPTTSSYTGKTSDGTGEGAFTSSLTSLSAATRYHVRAYAINSQGTGYGSEVDFSTIRIVPAVITTGSATLVTPVVTIAGLKTIAPSVLANAECSLMAPSVVIESNVGNLTLTQEYTSIHIDWTA